MIPHNWYMLEMTPVFRDQAALFQGFPLLEGPLQKQVDPIGLDFQLQAPAMPAVRMPCPTRHRARANVFPDSLWASVPRMGRFQYFVRF